MPRARLPNGISHPGRIAPAQESPVLFAQILLEQNLIGPDDLARLLAIQQSVPEDERRTIGELAVSQGYVDQSRLQSLLDSQGWRLYLGELLVMRGHLALAGMTRALREQKARGGKIGDVLLRLGLIQERELAEGLAEQCGVACVPITGIPLDPALTRWINPGFARAHGLVPIALQARSLAVAIWQPRSMAAASDIEQASGLTVNVVLTTRQEVEDRIRALYGSAEAQQAA